MITICEKQSQSKTPRHDSHLPSLVPSYCLSNELEVWVVGQAKIIESSTGQIDTSLRYFLPYQSFLSFSQRFNSFTLHWFTFRLVTHSIFRTYYSPHSSIMTRRRRTCPPPLPSSGRRSRQLIHDEDLDDDHSTIPDNDDERQVDKLESDNETLQRPCSEAMGKRLLTDSFTSILGKLVAATQLTTASAQHLHTEHREVYIVLEDEGDQRQPAPLASKKLSDEVFKSLILTGNVYVYSRKDSSESGEQLVAWKDGNQ